MTKREIGVLLHQHYRHDQHTNVILLLEDIRNYCDITRIDFDDCDYLAEDGYRGSQRARDNYGPRQEPIPDPPEPTDPYLPDDRRF